MHEFHLPDMGCGHCASRMTGALKRLDPGCEIELDLPRRLASVKSSEDREALVEALAAAGYPPL